MEKRAFVFGRRTRRSTLVLLLGPAACPIRGPWTLQAIISPN